MSEETKVIPEVDVDEGYKLTEEEVKKIADTLQEDVSKNENLRILSELPSNNGVEEHTPEQGEMVKADIMVDPVSGEKKVISINTEKPDEAFEDKLTNLGKSIENAAFSDDYEITEEDVKSAIRSDESILGEDFKLDDATTLEMIKLLNNYKVTKKVTYKDLPEQVRGYIDNYCSKMGIGGNSLQAKTMRNDIAELLISQYHTNIGLAKIDSEFQESVETLFTNLEKEVSPEFMNYNNAREEYLKKVIENVTDEEKKKKAEEILESINDAFALTRFKNMAKRIKIKKIDYEKPQREFRGIHAKYADSKFNIYDLAMVTNILHKHLVKNNIIPEEDVTSALKFTLGFCKCVQNYKVSDPENHAFMYYTTYNIILLDVYKAEQYDEYAPKFLQNVKEVIDLIK